MSPLEIHLLLNLYVSPEPSKCYPAEQAMAPAMVEALDKFERVGITQRGINHESIMKQCFRRKKADQFLTEKGMLLINRLLEISP